MFALVLALVACATSKERFVEDYAVAACEYRGECGLGGDVDGLPCEEHYATVVSEIVKACDVDAETMDACLAEIEAAECGDDTPACTDVLLCGE